MRWLWGSKSEEVGEGLLPGHRLPLLPGPFEGGWSDMQAGACEACFPVALLRNGTANRMGGSLYAQGGKQRQEAGRIGEVECHHNPLLRYLDDAHRHSDLQQQGKALLCRASARKVLS